MLEQKLDLSKLERDDVDCKSKIDMIDECGLQQGFSHRFNEFSYPTNHTQLLTSCKRQADALKCLRYYSTCLQPLPKQVLLAMVASRQKYNKKICAEKPTESATKLVELTQCMTSNKAAHERGVQAEMNSILVPEAIVNGKIETTQERIKHSCCSVARVRKDFLDALEPECQQYSSTASDIIDSYLADTVGIICPDFNTKVQQYCDKLPKLTTPKSSNARYFIRPIMNVIQRLV